MKIKSIITICLILPFFNQINAQNEYHPMEVVTDWYVQTGGFGGPSYFWYSYSGDTLFNNMEYRIISREIVENYFVNIYLRDDIINKKVLRFNPIQYMEYVYYDFSLEEGDHFKVSLGESSYTYQVDNIDSIPTNIGYLKRWNFKSDTHFGFSYIEAIGGDVLEYELPIFYSDPAYTTICVYNECEKIIGDNECIPLEGLILLNVIDTICPDEELYGISQEGSYEITLSSTEACDTLINLTLSIYDENDPNCLTKIEETDHQYPICFPSTIRNFINIQTFDIAYQIEIFENDGTILLKRKLKIYELNNIKLDNLASGLFYIKFKSDTRSFVQKFIKL